jgi:membrane protease YdiL (CAAX protease family)
MLSVKPWRPEAVAFFVFANFLCMLVGISVVGLLQKAGVSGFKSPEEFGYILVASLSFQGATLVLMGFFFHYHHVDWREELGFRNKNLPRSLFLALAVMVVILVAGYGLESVSTALMDKIGWMPKTEEAVALYTGATSLIAKIYFIFFAVVLVPVAEEFIFRGMLFPVLKQHGLPKTAWIGVSLFFAFIHGDAAAFISFFLLALALTWLYEKTNNLLAPIFAHALFNASGFLLLKYLPELIHANS